MDDDYVFANFDGMDQGSTALVRAAKEMEREVGELKARLAAVDWDSVDARQEFNVTMRKWDQAYRHLISIVHGSGGVVSDAGQLFQDVENWGRNAFTA